MQIVLVNLVTMKPTLFVQFVTTSVICVPDLMLTIFVIPVLILIEQLFLRGPIPPPMMLVCVMIPFITLQPIQNAKPVFIPVYGNILP